MDNRGYCVSPRLRRGYVCPKSELQGHVSCSEEKATSLSAFHCCICSCPHCFHSLNLSSCWLSPFHLLYVTVSRPCCLSEFYTNRASRKVWYSGYQDFKLPCTTYIQLLDSGGSRGGACPPPHHLFLDQGWKKIFLETGPPSYLRTWMAAPTPLIWRSGSATA